MALDTPATTPVRTRAGRGLTAVQKERIINELDDMARQSNGRPFVVVITQVDGAIHLRRTEPPVYIPPN